MNTLRRVGIGPGDMADRPAAALDDRPAAARRVHTVTEPGPPKISLNFDNFSKSDNFAKFWETFWESAT